MGKIALSGGARSRRRNRPRRDRHQPDHRRDLRAGELHVRHRRPVLQAVRHHGVGAGAVLAACRASRHADAGGLFPAAASARGKAAGARPARLHRASSTWSVRHYFITVVHRRSGVFAAVDLAASRCCRRASCRRRTPRARCLRSSCRPARGCPTPRRSPRTSSSCCAPGPRSSASSSTAGAFRRARPEVRKAALIINYTPKSKRSITQKDTGAVDQPRARGHSRHPPLVRRRERLARDLAGRHRLGQRDRRERRQRACQPDASRDTALVTNVIADTSLDRPELRILPAHGLVRPSRRLDREPVRDDPRRHHRRRRAGAGQVRHRRPAGADSRAARPTTRAPTSRGSSRCGCRSGGGRGDVPLSAIADIRLGQGPTSINRYDRAAAGDGRRRSRRACGARRRDEADLRAAGDGEPAEEASACSSSPATPKAWPSWPRLRQRR